MAELDGGFLEPLRQPLKDAVVTVVCTHSTITFPVSTILVGAMNPCPCGFRGLPEQKYTGSLATCIKYVAASSRLSGANADTSP